MTVIHVETIGAVGERDSITIPEAGGIKKKIAIIILRVGGVDRNIISWGLGLWRDLVTKLGSRDLFLPLALRNIVEGKLMMCGGVDPIPEIERRAGFITIAQPGR